VKIVSKIAEKILSHCIKCGGCPIARMMDAQAEIEDNTSLKAQLEKESKMKV